MKIYTYFANHFIFDIKKNVIAFQLSELMLYPYIFMYSILFIAICKPKHHILDYKHEALQHGIPPSTQGFQYWRFITCLG